MVSDGLEAAVPAIERPPTWAFDGMATVIGSPLIFMIEFVSEINSNKFPRKILHELVCIDCYGSCHNFVETKRISIGLEKKIQCSRKCCTKIWCGNQKRVTCKENKIA